MFKLIMTAFLLGVCLLGLSGQAHAELLGDYLGYKACVDCHGDIVAGWKKTPHGNAFEDLKQQGEEKQSIPGCFKCHVVGFETDGGYIDMNVTPELADVQCEACHGPGRKHVENGGDPAFITQKADEAVCRTCHTEGQDKNFDFEKKKLWVHTPQPKSQETTPQAAAGSLVFSSTRISFGDKMIEGDLVKKPVTITNTSKEVVTLVNVTTS